MDVGVIRTYGEAVRGRERVHAVDPALIRTPVYPRASLCPQQLCAPWVYAPCHDTLVRTRTPMNA
eukprot:2057469-Pleurochrysis_carterae.AAC.1